jgi:hypothetical protein
LYQTTFSLVTTKVIFDGQHLVTMTVIFDEQH